MSNIRWNPPKTTYIFIFCFCDFLHLNSCLQLFYPFYIKSSKNVLYFLKKISEYKLQTVIKLILIRWKWEKSKWNFFSILIHFVICNFIFVSALTSIKSKPIYIFCEITGKNTKESYGRIQSLQSNET